MGRRRRVGGGPQGIVHDFRGRRAANGTHDHTIESAAYDELAAAGVLTTHALVTRLRALGLNPHNLTTTLKMSKRIIALPRDEPTDRYRWHVKKKNGHS